MRERRDGATSLSGIIDAVEAAKRELLDALPSPRGVPGRPVADALLAYEEGLTRAATATREAAGLERAVTSACDAAIREALSRAERLRMEAPPLGYESLVVVLADLIEPLDPLAELPPRA